MFATVVRPEGLEEVVCDGTGGGIRKAATFADVVHVLVEIVREVAAAVDSVCPIEVSDLMGTCVGPGGCIGGEDGAGGGVVVGGGKDKASAGIAETVPVKELSGKSPRCTLWSGFIATFELSDVLRSSQVSEPKDNIRAMLSRLLRTSLGSDRTVLKSLKIISA